MHRGVVTALAVSISFAFCGAAVAQAPPSYGMPITIEQAKKVAAAAVAESTKNNWGHCIAIVAPSGDLTYFERMDNCQYGSIAIALRKAKAAAIFKRPTKSFEDRLAQGGGGLTLLTLDGVIASEGGLPILVDGKIIGAIGISGATGAQDAQAATAGLNALK
jgi:uncharacterized protein GlcG (DUF336 family)